VAASVSVAQVTFLSAAALQLDRNVRKTAVSALILMRNKGVVEPLNLLEIFFRLLAVVPDKGLREMLYRHLVNDVRNLNKKHKADSINRSIQAFLHRIVSTHGVSGEEDDSSTNVAAKKAVDMVCELYRRRVWNDERTVAIVASAVTSQNQTAMCRALRFFLNIEETMAEDAAKKLEVETDAKSRIYYHAHSKKTAARQRHIDRQLKNRKKALRRKEGGGDWMEAGVEQDKGVEASRKLYPAIELLRDPQGLAEGKDCFFFCVPRQSYYNENLCGLSLFQLTYLDYT
jgi:protein SDA1